MDGNLRRRGRIEWYGLVQDLFYFFGSSSSPLTDGRLGCRRGLGPVLRLSVCSSGFQWTCCLTFCGFVIGDCEDVVVLVMC